ncbi:Anaerobic dehydrogenases, typicallyselenocysteine-containing [Synechocystis sp. PCC 6803]|nr:hypothetical protein C7I86_15795 [Synechocystis sp. IPPAS B-1465]BAM53414.1 Anaerobic dehydrogenases, typicallyselenocysteine-containing [Synechocystis sp. PCC 6803] [Bacillus subtilis BEST7613]
MTVCRQNFAKVWNNANPIKAKEISLRTFLDSFIASPKSTGILGEFHSLFPKIGGPKGAFKTGSKPLLPIQMARALPQANQPPDSGK